MKIFRESLKQKIFFAIFSLWVVSFTAIAATDNEGLLFVPESNPVLKFSSQNSDEEIDPFTGNLTLRHTDLVLPGTNGMDLRITREWDMRFHYEGLGGRSSAPYHNQWVTLGHSGWHFSSGYYTANYGRLIDQNNPFTAV
ncbi:MAG: hypothetical protein COB71_00140 [Thiotrichales bacterium]|nr:MAG: hypothetical protein COB71_00140 [Thiotrichales bacterium]